MSRSIFTPEELAELAAADAEIEADEALTLEEYRETMRRDREISGPRKPYSESRKNRAREYARKRRSDPAVAEKGRQAHRDWYDKNRDYALAWQREYYLTHSDAKRRATEALKDRLRGNPEAAEVLARRKALGMTQRQLGAVLGRSCTVIHYWETGKTNVPAWAMERLRAMTWAAPHQSASPTASPRGSRGVTGAGHSVAT